MNEFVYKFTLDLNCAKTPPVICSGQFDKGRKFEFTITANGQPYDVTGCSAVLKGVRTDGSHFAVECTVSGGKITKTLDDTTLSVRGKTVAKLVISDSEKSYSTQMFIIDVDSALDGDITVADDYSILNRLIEQIHALNESGAIIIDDTINNNSNNAVANKAVAIALAQKSDKSATYTKTELDTALAKKPDKSTTLAGYGITDGENIGNKVTDKSKITDEDANYPSIGYLNDYYYDYSEVDDALSGKLDNTAGSVTTDNIANGAITTAKLTGDLANCIKIITGETTTVENSFRVWGPNATDAMNGDIVTELYSGYYDKITGQPVSTAAFGCTIPLIEINEDATIYAYNLYDFSAGYAITFFDENKTVISGVGGTGNSNVRITGEQTVPLGAKYIAVTLLKSDPGMYAQITTRETFTTSSLDTQIESIKSDTTILKSQVKKLTNDVSSVSIKTETLNYNVLSSFNNYGYYDINGAFQSTTSWRCTNYLAVSEGDKLTVKLTSYNTVNSISYFDKNHKYISGVVGDTWSWNTSVYPLNGEHIVPPGAYFMRVSVFIADYATEQYVIISRSVIGNIENNLDIINGKPLNILVLGDSYSEMGRWINGMKEVIEIKNIVNLGVSSATIKDRYSDRTTYPYSDRPDKSDGSGNTNTLSSQIQKLKRLMTGTDLDSGESKIYTSKLDYPDIIIIEGGMNDTPDSDEVIATYHNQFMTKKTAYYKQNKESSVIQTTVWIKPSLDEIDRTCFAGAYRYLCEELITLFPDAQIFLTTASHMNYFTVNPNERYGKIAEQQRKCADIMSYTVIDWHAEGNLNTMMISLNGSGTVSDPYTPIGGNEYTTDLLHPNDKGALRYGKLAGRVIAQKYLGL